MIRAAKLRPNLRLTDRDLRIITLLARLRVLRDADIQAAYFGHDHKSCERRLRQLYDARYIDRLPRRSVTSPYIYLLGRRSVRANRILKERWGDQTFRQSLTPLVNIDHQLGINAVRVRLMRACRDLGWTLKNWLTAEQLAPALAASHQLVPDAFFGIERQVNDEVKTAGFCLELQRSLKSSTVLAEKLDKYQRLYYSGQYAATFGLRSLRVLFVYTSEDGVTADHRVDLARRRAKRAGNTLARFASLDGITHSPSVDILIKPIWWRPDQDDPISLYSV